MSKKSNVNPDHYKVAGRTRQGEDIVQDIQVQKYAQSRHDATAYAPAAASKALTKRKRTRSIGKTQKIRMNNENAK